MTGKDFKEANRIPTMEQTVKRFVKQSKSKYPLRFLGSNEGTELLISEEERGEHLHVIGTTGEGKSRFLEHLIREDINRGNGLCLLDPSDRGDTVRKVLAYCAKVGHKKVLLIDPIDMLERGKVVPMNPLRGSGGVSLIRDAIQTTFGNKDQSDTARIQKYLPAILTVLQNAGLTIREIKYFSNPIFVRQRMEILERTDPLDRHRLALEEVFNKPQMYANEFQSTLRRLDTFSQASFDLMFSSYDGIKFTDLISQGWVVLVSLYAQDEFEPIHGKLLGSLIINMIISAIDKLRKNGWKGRYYLYIDEAGQYATYKLANLLAYKRKSGLAVIIAHQYFNQFEDKAVLDAVLNLCKLKVAFNIPNPDDRLKVVKMFYGGALADRDVSYALSQTKQQHAVVKLSKRDPALIKIPDVPDITVDMKPYLETLYNGNSYKNVSDILDEQSKRFEGQDSIRPERRTQPKRRAVKQTDRRKIEHSPESLEASSRPEIDSPETNTDRLWDSVFLEDGGGQTEGTN